jgi:hypothetical protein
MKWVSKAGAIWWLGTLLTSISSASIARADLRFFENRADAGVVPTGSRLVHRFRFVNDGPEKAVITGIRRSCGCLAPKIEPREYSPNEQGSLELEVNTLTQAAGRQLWTLHVDYLMDRRRCAQELQLTAQMIPQITIEPAALVVQAERAPEHKLILTDQRMSHLHVLDIRTTSAHLSGKVSGEGTDGRGHWQSEIALRADKSLAIGRQSAEVLIYTDDAIHPILKVPVTILSDGQKRIGAIPDEVHFVASGNGSMPCRMIRLRDNQNAQVTIERVDVRVPALVCTWANGPGKQATLKVQIDSGFVEKSFEGTIDIRLASPEPLTITIPVKFSRP